MIAREKFIKDYRKKEEIERAKLDAQRNKHLAEKEAKKQQAKELALKQKEKKVIEHKEKKEDAKKIVKRGHTHVYHIIPVDGGRKWIIRKMGDQKIVKSSNSQTELINFYKKNIDSTKAKLYVHDKNGKYHLYK